MVEYKDDEIFLLSAEEYEKYKDNIPVINNWWWLRSPGLGNYDAVVVFSDGSLIYYGEFIADNNGCVRPALKINDRCEVGDRIIKYSFPWIVIDTGLAIAEIPIAFMRFDKESNDYETSEIRQFLFDWINDR